MNSRSHNLQLPSYRLMIISIKAGNSGVSEVEGKMRYGVKSAIYSSIHSVLWSKQRQKGSDGAAAPQMSCQANMKEHKLTKLSLSHDISSRPRSMAFLLCSTLDKDLLPLSVYSLFCSNQKKNKKKARDVTPRPLELTFSKIQIFECDPL